MNQIGLGLAAYDEFAILSYPQILTLEARTSVMIKLYVNLLRLK